MDIGIVPLNTLPFNEAKSSLKGMEYAFTGMPFVAADTQEYRKLRDDGAGNVAKRPAQWIKHMERLIDPAERKKEADRGYETVMRDYNIYHRVDEWMETIERIRLANPKRKGK
jgi:spore maturation protein CgeB